MAALKEARKEILEFGPYQILSNDIQSVNTGATTSLEPELNLTLIGGA